MTRVAGWLGGADGLPRLSAGVNTVATDLIAASAAVDGRNLAPEGLDARNIDANSIVEMETTGSRLCFVASSANTLFQGDGANNRYRAEGTTVSTINVPMELDWGAGYALGADEYLLIEGVVHFGGSAQYGLSKTVVAPFLSGVSVAILVWTAASGAYVNTDARQSRGGMPNQIGAIPTVGDNIRGDAFDLAPKHIVASGTVVKIGLVVGVGLSAGILARASAFQLSTRIIKKAR